MCVCMCMCLKVTQLHPTLCDPMDYTIQGILQARIPEWVAFPFSRGSSQPRDRTQVSRLDSLPAELPGKPHYERFLPPSSFNLLTSSGSDRLLPLLCLPFPCFTVSICCLFILPAEVPLGFVVKLVWCRILLNFSFDFSIKSEHEPL